MDWDSAAAQAPEESVEVDGFPESKWFIGTTCTQDNGNAKPRSQEMERKSDGSTFYKYNVGVQANGCEDSLENGKSYTNQIAYLNIFLHPGDREDSNNPISGRMAGFLNAVFSGGVGDDITADSVKERNALRTAARWHHTIGALKAIAEENPDMTLETYNGDKGLFFASLATIHLEQSGNGKRVLFKTGKKRSYEKDGEKKIVQPEISQIEDFNEANVAKHKVSLFQSAEEF